MVVIAAPVMSLIALTQDRIASPFLCTVQAPHSAMPQPNFAPVSFNSSRRYQSNGISGSPSNERSIPLTLSRTIFSSPFNQENPKSEYSKSETIGTRKTKFQNLKRVRLEVFFFLNT